jgi:hypothetical protein
MALLEILQVQSIEDISHEHVSLLLLLRRVVLIAVLLEEIVGIVHVQSITVPLIPKIVQTLSSEVHIFFEMLTKHKLLDRVQP